MSVGRTNALRAGNLTSEASSTEKMDCTPPHDTHHWLLHHVYKPWTLSQLAQVISGRSCSTFRCASSLSTFAPPVCPLASAQFLDWISQCFILGFLSTALGLIFSVLHGIQCAKCFIFSMISCDERAVLSYFLSSFQVLSTLQNVWMERRTRRRGL